MNTKIKKRAQLVYLAVTHGYPLLYLKTLAQELIKEVDNELKGDKHEKLDISNNINPDDKLRHCKGTCTNCNYCP